MGDSVNRSASAARGARPRLATRPLAGGPPLAGRARSRATDWFGSRGGPGVETEPAHPRRPALGWLCRPGADGASAPARSAASTPGSTAAGSGTPPLPRTWPSSPRCAASPMKRSPVITASRRSRSRATAAAAARLVAGGEDGRRGPPPGTAAPGPRRARRRPGPGRGGSLRWGRRRRRDRRRRHPLSPSGAARRTRRARTRDVRFVKGGVARAGCRRRCRPGGNRSGAADLAAVLVTYQGYRPDSC